MLCIQTPVTDPYFNIASEEYLLKNFTDDVFMLYRNSPSIIVGKHQNTLAEINPDFVRKNNIPVVRRLSGGGTVFHDLGNINFCFILNGEAGKLVDFRKYTQPIIDFLKTLGVEAKFEGKNDLRIHGKKFSGNAEHVYKKRVLHHGTILFSANINDLSDALKVDESKFTDKSVKSIRSEVTNISRHLANEISIDHFIDKLMQYVRSIYPEANLFAFSREDLNEITKLTNEKYRTWAWNFGHSPDYQFKRKTSTNLGDIEINLEVKKSVITKAVFRADFSDHVETGILEKLLTGTKHDPDEISNCMKKAKFDERFQKMMIKALF